ncbi:MAG TPA: methionine synthase [Mycobacterium sp.]|nr:methionine synthase [Mycobacterium sp.]
MSSFASATGVGSWPGSAARPAAEVVVGELHQLPHLVELPARGVGADMIGRAGALLVDIALDTVPRGYRLTARPGAVMRRAISLLGEDIDALEEAWEKAGAGAPDRVVKVQAPGPVTLAAQLELGGGHRAITDAGAVRDLTASLAEGVAVHAAEVSRRLGAAVVVQFDEPSLPAALAGRLTGVTGVSPVHAVEALVATDLLNMCASIGPAAVHCCAADIPWKVLQDSAIQAVSVDAATLQAADLDGIGQFLESGRTVLLGVVPTTAPPGRPAVEEVATAAAKVTDRLGFSRAVLRDQVGITPACGLAGATPEWARIAVELCQKAADGFTQDPEAI